MVEHSDLHKSKWLESIKNFSIGGTAGIVATTAVLPMDFIKVHLQCAAEGSKGPRISPLQFASTVYREKGLLAFYKGLDSAILRQALYATTRLGLYKTLADREKEKTGTKFIPFFKKFIYSTVSGGIGAFVGNPCDLSLIRLQTDNTLPPQLRRNYKNAIDALLRIPKEEGILAYWKGCTPTILRAAALNFGMLAPYDQTKEFLDSRWKSDTMNRILASVIAAIFACFISLPFDNIKTKYQKMIKGADGKYPYKGFYDCLMKSLKNEGFIGLYVGLDAYALRVAPNVIITLLTIDFLHYLYHK
ncbi:unnamed protein product [Blepharisma stoltei]|uniref:Uncharacterized protein n=1 Tax=Blepharisma stoltei TaxID=1481888 RepID=A0AAU9JAJ5_9CILI|nr:unnamed protein product [Blepharisma stoltei]